MTRHPSPIRSDSSSRSGCLPDPGGYRVSGSGTLRSRKGEQTMMRSIAATLSLLALEACVHEQVFEPAAGASLAPGRQNVAEAIAAGVTVKAARDSWKGDPKDLGSLFTPVRVIIQNHSWKPLRVSYGDFSLSGASGFQYAAIPPIKALTMPRALIGGMAAYWNPLAPE